MKIPFCNPVPPPDGDLLREVTAVASQRFRRHGFKSVTMDDIARELGRSKKTLYQVVTNKQELIDLVIDRDIQADEAAIVQARAESADAIEEMLHIARYFTDSMRQMSPAALYDLQKYYRPTWERIDRHHTDEMIADVRANLRRGQGEGLYREDLDRELIAQLFTLGPRAFTDVGRFEVRDGDWAHVLGQFMRYHLLGIASDRGRAVLEGYLRRDNPTP